MIDFKHPSQLNPYQIYQQANRIAKKTSRSKNSDWYVSAVEIQRQWHLWVGDKEIVSAVLDKKAGRWIEGPSVPSLLENQQSSAAAEGLDEAAGGESGAEVDIEELKGALAEVLRSRELGGKVKSLGIVWHIANEFAVLDLSRDYSGLDDFDNVQNLLQDDPQLVLGDASIDPLLNNWRLMPYWGVKEGGRRSVVIQTGKASEDFLAAARNYGEEQNVAIVTVAASAPLEALAVLPLSLGGEDLERGSIIVLQYQTFSAMVGLNATGELVLLRSLQHRVDAGYYTGLGDVLVNTKALLGFDDPVVHILPMVEGPGTERLTSELTKFFMGREPMDIGFLELDQVEMLQSVPGGRLEMLMGDPEGVMTAAEGIALINNVTYAGLHAEGWAMQDFAPLPLEIQEVYPTWQDMQLRKWFGFVKIALVLVAAGILMWGGTTYMSVTSTPGWKLSPDEAGLVSTKAAELDTSKKEIDFWEKIMMTRSHGWSNMELILKLFPPNEGVVITSCRYSAESVPFGGKKEKNAGLRRSWTFQGFAIPTAIPRLNKLGTTKAIKQIFTEFAEETGAKEFDMTPATRELLAVLDRKQGNYPPSGALPPEEAAKYQLAFDMTITQTFNDGDSLVIPLKE